MGRVEQADKADKRRRQAEELRAKAELLSDHETRIGYLRMAEICERLADNEEKVAENPGKTR
jgi:hypothetical protein